MGFARLFQMLDGGAFGYALSEDGSTCIQLGTHGSLTGVSPAASLRASGGGAHCLMRAWRRDVASGAGGREARGGGRGGREEKCVKRVKRGGFCCGGGRGVVQALARCVLVRDGAWTPEHARWRAEAGGRRSACSAVDSASVHGVSCKRWRAAYWCAMAPAVASMHAQSRAAGAAGGGVIGADESRLLVRTGGRTERRKFLRERGMVHPCADMG